MKKELKEKRRMVELNETFHSRHENGTSSLPPRLHTPSRLPRTLRHAAAQPWRFTPSQTSTRL